MVVSDATRADSGRDKALMTDAPAAPEMQDASESSQANPRSIGQRPPEREACIKVGALKNFMTTMTDTILQQVTEQVKKTMEVMGSMRPLPAFDYVPTSRYKLSHRRTPAKSLCRSDEVREIARPRGTDGPTRENMAIRRWEMPDRSSKHNRPT